LLDLSAAFDTIDHKILFDEFSNINGGKDTALKWFESNLEKQTQSVVVNYKESTKKQLKYAVPQGSKLWPVLFNAYIAPLSKVAESYVAIDQRYADEQFLLSFKSDSHTDTFLSSFTSKL
jgi:hypothetical protein